MTQLLLLSGSSKEMTAENSERDSSGQRERIGSRIVIFSRALAPEAS